MDNRHFTISTKFLPILFILLGWLVLSDHTQAQTTYRLLAPLPLAETDCTGSAGEECQTTTSPYIRGVFILVIGLAGVLAVVKIIFGGIQYMSTDAFSGKSDAKETINNAIWGLLLVIGAWLILSTINPKLVSFNLDFSSGENAGTAEVAVQTVMSGLSESGARDFLAQNGITVDSPTACPEGMTAQQYREATSQQECTTLARTTQKALDAVVAFKNACVAFDPTCTIQIKEGGESYASGNKVGIAETPITTAFLKSFQLIGQRSDGALTYQCPKGITCASS
jgi:hypothetical protein